MTNWLPWVTSRAGENNIWNPPDVGEQVVILSPSGELSLGVILPAIYQQKYPALENKKETNSIVFQDGTRFSYNSRNRHFEICVIDRITLKVGESSLEITKDSINLKARRIDLN